MDNFEEMTNQDLHLKLLEFGLPNMPVTQTTRKVIIKKLVNHIEGGVGIKGKNRRETIHQVMKYSSDEDATKDDKKESKEDTASIKKNRRATIGGDKLSKTLPLAVSTPEPKTTRKSGRVTPSLQSSRTITTSFAPEKEKEIVINEESDEEELQYSQMPKLKRRVSKSRSKSPSPLSKGQTITTSYVNVVEKKVIPEVTEMEVDSDEAMIVEDDVVEEIVKPPTPKLARRSVSRASANEPVSSTSRHTMFNQTVGGHERAADLGPIEAPYLSEFARRLSRLTVEHNKEAVVTRKSVAAPIQAQYRPSTSSDFHRPSQFQMKHLSSKPKPAPVENGIRESLHAVVMALDRNFPIRKALFYIIILLTVIFVYVFFFM